MSRLKIVLTGGPCAGKSEILERLVECLSKNDKLRILTVPETASEILGSGIKFKEVNKPLNFQKLVIQRQLNKEQTLVESIGYLPLKENNIIILDRGLMDNKAYIDDGENFEKLFRKYNLQELSVLDDYDLVINLVSLAVTNPEKYGNQNNEERYETLEEAVTRDRKTIDAWLGHKNIKYIYPTDNIEDKFNTVLTYVNELIEKKQRKNHYTYLIETPSDILEGLNKNNSKIIEVTDYYLKFENDDNHYILRKRKDSNTETKSLIIKDKDENIISDSIVYGCIWDDYLKDYEVEKEVRKVQYTTNVFGHVCTINCYDDFTTLEIPKTNYNQSTCIINNFKVLEYISNFESFYNKRYEIVPKVKKYGNI